jgi:hypothetical protein
VIKLAPGRRSCRDPAACFECVERRSLATLISEGGTLEEDLAIDLVCDLYHFDLQAEPGKAD